MKLYQAIRVDEVLTLHRQITVLWYVSLPVSVFGSCQGRDLLHMHSDFSTVTVPNYDVVDWCTICMLLKQFTKTVTVMILLGSYFVLSVFPNKIQ